MEFRTVKTFPSLQRRSSRSAFSFIELLVVMGIIGSLLYVTIPASMSLQQSSNLNLAGQAVADAIASARQFAAGANRVVEVRFLAPTNWSTIGSPNYTGFHAIQLWAPNESGVSVPVDRLITLPDGIEISGNSALSPLLHTPIAAPEVTTNPAAPYVSFFIRPAGNVTVLGTAPGTTGTGTGTGTDTEDSAGTRAPSYFFTILSVRYDSNAVVPVNYVTLQVNPDTGHTQTYRP
jgi:uncharacterized protein (TIGR02596 family)